MIGVFLYMIVPSFHGKYTSSKQFLMESFWNDMLYRILIMQGIAWIFIFPLNIQKNLNKLRFSSMLGLLNIILITIVIIVQLPMYLDYNSSVVPADNDYNFFDIYSSFKDFSFFKGFSIILFSYSTHYGSYPIHNAISNRTKLRTNIYLIASLLIISGLFTIIGTCGYLTQPTNTPLIIVDRKELNYDDIAMTICRLLFSIVLCCKIPLFYNFIRSNIILALFNSHNISVKSNIIITVLFTFFSALIGGLYNKLDNIVSLLGSFGGINIAFLAPLLLYIKTKKTLLSFKSVIIISILVLLMILGIFTLILTIISIITNVK